MIDPEEEFRDAARERRDDRLSSLAVVGALALVVVMWIAVYAGSQ